MNLPKYFNPHLTFDTTRIVSRRTLQLEDDIDDNTEQGGDHREELDRLEVEDLRAKLDKTVSKRFKLTQTPTSSDGSHFNKRRKVQPEEGGRTSVEPRQDSEPVSKFISSRSPSRSYLNSSPSLPSGIKIITPSRHSSHPKPTKKHPVRFRLYPRRYFQSSSLRGLCSVSKNRLVKTRNRNSKSASIGLLSLLSISTGLNMHSQWCAHSGSNR